MLHADETPVAMLDPGAGKTKRAYIWVYPETLFPEIASRPAVTSLSIVPASVGSSFRARAASIAARAVAEGT